MESSKNSSKHASNNPAGNSASRNPDTGAPSGDAPADGESPAPSPAPSSILSRPIQVLPDAVIDKIAAGEVVERPASVVKELVENALDAGASQVSVSVEEGGKALISVLDNGHGIPAGEALLAVQRHATSKLRGEEELARIATLGFRGEALASIASVSHFEMITCADEARGGFRVSRDGGGEWEQARVGFPRGTKVTVAELFHNTPARRKFMRTTPTEFRHVQEAVAQLAMAHPGVHFRLLHKQKIIQDLPRCGQLSERIYQLFGRELSAGLGAVEGAEATLAYRGLISHPEHARGSRRWQYLFVNGRPIRNPGINHAVYQAYRSLLMKDRHPAYVLMLHLSPGEVDVNVHPAKSEVRMRNPQLVHTVLSSGLHKALLQGSRSRFFAAAGNVGAAPGAEGELTGLPQNSLPGLAAPVGGDVGRPLGSLSRRDAAAFPASGLQTLGDHGGMALSGGESAFPGEASGPSGGAPGSPFGGNAPGTGLRPNPYAGEGFHFQPLGAPATMNPGNLGGAGVAGGGEGFAERAEGGIPPLPSAEALQSQAGLPDGELLDGGMNVLAQYHLTYLLVQREDSLLLVDQHAAHERILFERYRTQFYEGRPVRERFLVPVSLELSPQNALLLEQYIPQWEKMGFEMESFGRGNFLVREVPALMKDKDVLALILEVLDELALFGKSGRLEEVLNGIMVRVACHAAIRAGDPLSREEMQDLMDQLTTLDINLHCPHGRPVWVEFPLRELEKRFKRIV